MTCSLQNDSRLFCEGFYGLSRLKHTRDFLSTLQLTLENAITLLESSIMPRSFSYGLGCLPDTLLSDVFDILCAEVAEQDSMSFQGASKVANLRNGLALVSRRFRRVALSTPSIWSYVNSWDAELGIASSLKLSRALPLQLTLQVNGSRSEFRQMLSCAVPHIHRWKSLCLREIGVQRWAHLRSILAGAPFSSITTLRFTEFCPQGFLDEHAFPALRELDIVYLIPPLHIMKRLTSLKISHPCAEHGRPIDYLLKALGYARKLESLDIMLEPGDFLDVVYRSEPCAEPVAATLPSLVSVSVRALDWARRLDARLFRFVAWFTRALHTPRLTSVAFEVSCFNVGFAVDDLKFFPAGSVLDTVRRADLRVGLTNYDFRLDDPEEVCAFDAMAQQTKIYLRTILSRMPAIEDLSLHVPGFVMDFSYPVLCPGLRYFYMKGPHAIGAVDLHRFSESGRKNENRLESVTIVTVAVDTARTFYGGQTKESVVMEEKAGKMYLTWREVKRMEERKEKHAIAVLARSA